MDHFFDDDDDESCRSCRNGQFQFRSITADQLCVFCVLHLLYDRQNDENIRHALVDRLFQLPAHDIEFIMPQLCHMALTCAHSFSQDIGDVLVARAAIFMHFAIKLTFWLDAASYYLDDAAKQRARVLIQRIEICVVNAESDNKRFRVEKLLPISPQQQQQLIESSTHLIDVIKQPEEITSEYVVKQARREYYRTHLKFYQHLNRISERLTPLPRPKRKVYLPKLLGSYQPMGLYFPIFSGPDEHYMIHTLFPQEAIVLNSRDKAPFLLWTKIEFTDKPNFSEDIYEKIIPYVEQQHIFDDITTLPSSPVDNNDAVDGQPLTPEEQQQQQLSDVPELSSTSSTSIPSGEGRDENDINDTDLSRETTPILSLTRQKSNTSHREQRHNAHDDDDESDPVDSEDMLAPEQLPDIKSLSLNTKDMVVDNNAASSPSPRTATSKSPTAAAAPAPPQASPIEPTEVMAAHFAAPDATTTAPLKQQQQQSDEKAVSYRDFNPFGESFDDRSRRLLGEPETLYANDDHGDFSLLSVIFKGGDDCRQEVLAMQLIHLFDEIWQNEQLPLVLRPYAILATGWNSGMIETIPNSTSIDGLKKSLLDYNKSFPQFFLDYFSSKNCYNDALDAYIQSIAAYSLVSYFLQIKDRHNGNIMMDNIGHIIHIDFGFILSSSPGGNMNFENVPFKLTAEYVEVMQGENSEAFSKFKLLFVKGFMEARKHAHKFILLTEIMQNSNMAAFMAGGKYTMTAFRQRFALDMSDSAAMTFAVNLVNQSCNHWRSNQYDKYQYVTNGIL